MEGERCWTAELGPCCTWGPLRCLGCHLQLVSGGIQLMVGTLTTSQASPITCKLPCSPLCQGRAAVVVQGG